MMVYIVKVDEYVDGSKEVNEMRVFTDKNNAQMWFNELVAEESKNRDLMFDEENSDTFFECWEEGDYAFNHTTIEMFTTKLE